MTLRPEPRRPRRHRSIATRVMVLVGVGALTTLGLLGLASWSALNSAETSMEQTHQAMADLTARELESRLQVVLSALQRLANDARASEPLLLAQPELEARALETWQVARLDGLMVMTLDGHVWARAPSGYAHDPAFVASALARIREAPRPRVFSEPVAGTGKTRVALLVPLWSWRGDLIGAVGGELDPAGKRFAQLLGPITEVPSWHVDVVDDGGRELYSTLPATPHEAPAATAPLAIAPWHVVIRGSTGVSPSRGFWGRLLWLAPLLIAGSLLLAWGTAWSVRRPLLKLTRAAARLADGDLSTPVVVTEVDEVGRLGAAFESMRQALEATQRELQDANAALEQRVQARTLELQQANRQLRDREHARQVLLRKVITAQEDERKRVAREVHDEACQTVTALGLRLDTLLASPVAGDLPELTRARELASRCLDELHRLMRALRPPLLDDMGLVAALRQYAEQLSSETLTVRFESSVGDVSLAPETQTAVFRAAQEALNNVVRHARAEMALIQVSAERDTLCIDVEDDGVGFDVEALPPTYDLGRGLGLLGMRERVELAGGAVDIHSTPGNGTHVAIRVPLYEGRNT